MPVMFRTKWRALEYLGIITLVVLATIATGDLLPTVAAAPDQGVAKDKKKLKGDLQKLLREKWEALEKLIKSDLSLIDVGKRLPDVTLMDHSRQLLQARLEDQPKKILSAHEAHVKIMEAVEKVIEGQHEAGKLSILDYQLMRAPCLEAKIGLARVKIKGTKPTAEEAAQINKLVRERRKALKIAVKAIFEVIGGRGTPDFSVFDTSRLLLQAELESENRPEKRLKAHQDHLDRMKECEKVLAAYRKKDAIRAEDYALGKAALLEAEIGYLRAKAHGKKLTAKETGAIKKLLHARREALQQVVTEQEKRIEEGRISPTLNFLESASLLLQAELELTAKLADQIPLYQKNIKLAKALEDIMAAQVKAGKCSEDGYLEFKAGRLDAEIRLIRAKIGDNKSAR
jgi:hypothetical protein